VVLVPLAVAALLAACTSTGQSPARPQPPTAARANAAQASAAQAGAATSDGCTGQPPVSPPPVWARSGFSPADQAMPHAMGEAGIVAILWASRDVLHSPSLPDRNNKILWVSRIPLVASDPLVIKATLAGSTGTVTASAPGGSGQSIINLPTLSWWRLHLRWSGHTDELKLRYVA
jgi:hypothetical protein